MIHIGFVGKAIDPRVYVTWEIDRARRHNWWYESYGAQTACVGVYRVCAGSPIASIASHNMGPVVCCAVVWWAVLWCDVVGQRATVVVKNDNTCERASGRKAEWHWRQSWARCEDYLIGCLLLGRGKHPPTFLTTHKSLNSLWRWGGNRDRIPFFPSILTWSDSLGIFLKKTPSFEFSNWSEVHNVSKIYPSTNISQ